MGPGTLTLTGDLSYTGSTTIAMGTLELGDGGTGGSFDSSDVWNDGALVVNRSDSLTIAAYISGTGSLTKLGDGTLTLLTPSPINTVNDYTGTTSILGGTLEADGGAMYDSDILEIDNGATLRMLATIRLYRFVEILEGGGTIDTGAFDLDILEGVYFEGQLTKTGSGTLFLDRRLRGGRRRRRHQRHRRYAGARSDYRLAGHRARSTSPTARRSPTAAA
jgi:autotransporter-associated beta strand protein